MTNEVDAVDKLTLLRAKRDLLARKARLQRDFGLCFYRPYKLKDGSPGPQEQFHRHGNFKHRLWESGNKGGKTHGGTAEDCAFLMGERLWYPESDPARRLGIPQKPNVGLVIAEDWDKVGELFTGQTVDPKTTGRVWQLLPRGFVAKTKRNHSGVISEIECTNGSILRFDTIKSFSSNPGGAESSDYDFIHVDEPCPQDMFKAHSRGLIPTNGKTWFLITLLKEAWIHDMFFPSRRFKGETLISANETRWALRSSTYDNTTLSKEAIDDFESTLTADEIQCRINGIPLELSGLVYKEFKWEQHVMDIVPKGWKAFDDPPANYTIYVAIDPHPQTPHHVLFLAVAPTGHLFLFDEIFVHCTINELCERINLKLNGRFCIRVICDPLGFIEHPITNTSMADEFMAGGLIVSKATKALQQGILRVKQTLKADPQQLWVSPQLDETLTEFTHYAWDERENKPKDENDHAMENLYRLLLEDPIWISPDAGAGFVLPDLVIDRAELNLPDFSLD